MRRSFGFGPRGRGKGTREDLGTETFRQKGNEYICAF